MMIYDLYVLFYYEYSEGVGGDRNVSRIYRSKDRAIKAMKQMYNDYVSENLETGYENVEIYVEHFAWDIKNCCFELKELIETKTYPEEDELQ